MNLRSSSQPEKRLRGCSSWPKPSLRNMPKPRVSICVDINPLLESSEQKYFLLLWGSHYRVTMFSQPFTSTVINHAPFNYWFVIYSPNPFQILLLIFTSFFNPVLGVLLITLLHCHRLFQHRHVEPEVVWSLAVLYVQWIVCYCDIYNTNGVYGRWSTALNYLDSYL